MWSSNCNCCCCCCILAFMPKTNATYESHKTLSWHHGIFLTTARRSSSAALLPFVMASTSQHQETLISYLLPQLKLQERDQSKEAAAQSCKCFCNVCCCWLWYSSKTQAHTHILTHIHMQRHKQTHTLSHSHFKQKLAINLFFLLPSYDAIADHAIPCNWSTYNRRSAENCWAGANAIKCKLLAIFQWHLSSIQFLLLHAVKSVGPSVIRRCSQCS